MSDYSQLRKGDSVRIVLEGVVHSQASGPFPYSKSRTVRLSVVDEKQDVNISWDSEKISPHFEILHTELNSGDVAEIRVPGNIPQIRRALYVSLGNGHAYWVDAKGNTWSSIKHKDIVRFIDRVPPEV